MSRGTDSLARETRKLTRKIEPGKSSAIFAQIGAIRGKNPGVIGLGGHWEAAVLARIKYAGAVSLQRFAQGGGKVVEELGGLHGHLAPIAGEQICSEAMPHNSARGGEQQIVRGLRQ